MNLKSFLWIAFSALFLVRGTKAYRIPVPAVVKSMRPVVEFLSSSVGAIFQPMKEPNKEALRKYPRVKVGRKINRVKAFRRAHRKHRWDNFDIAQDFADRFLSWARVSGDGTRQVKLDDTMRRSDMDRKRELTPK